MPAGVPPGATLAAQKRSRMLNGTLISFEGVDGSGKTTQIRRLAAALRGGSRPLVLTREPGGTRLGERVRQLVLESTDEPPSPRAELALIFAARAQHIDNVIVPALERGAVVLTDRFTDASEAYQGAGRGLGREIVRELERLLCRGIKPDLTLIFDIDARQAVSRARVRLRRVASEEGRFESEDAEFFERVRQSYLDIARREPERCAVIAADQTIEQVAAAVQQVIHSRLGIDFEMQPATR